MQTSITLAPELAALRTARDLADVAAVPTNLVEAVRVVIAELASNAVHHARTPFTVTVWVEPEGGVLVTVHDDDHGQPVLQAVDRTSVRGRGLQVIAGLAERWGSDVDPADGKTVWAHIVR